MLRRVAVVIAALTFACMGPVAAAQAATPTSHKAVLAGNLGYEGGAPPGKFHPTSGTVEVEYYSQPLVLEKHVGKSGHFRITLAPGRYTVIGCGPSSGSTQGQCSKPTNVTLSPGEVLFVKLVWAMVP